MSLLLLSLFVKLQDAPKLWCIDVTFSQWLCKTMRDLIGLKFDRHRKRMTELRQPHTILKLQNYKPVMATAKMRRISTGKKHVLELLCILKGRKFLVWW